MTIFAFLPIGGDAVAMVSAFLYGGISQSDKMYSYPGSDVDLYCDRNSFYSDAFGSIYGCKHIDYPVNVFLTAIQGIMSYL